MRKQENLKVTIEEIEEIIKDLLWGGDYNIKDYTVYRQALIDLKREVMIYAHNRLHGTNVKKKKRTTKKEREEKKQWRKNVNVVKRLSRVTS